MGKVILKPFIKWVGGKSQLLSDIRKLILNNGDIAYEFRFNKLL
jgi:site-specific DNA-adenine methylase